MLQRAIEFNKKIELALVKKLGSLPKCTLGILFFNARDRDGMA